MTGGARVKVTVPWGGRRPCALARPTPPPPPISDWTGASLSSIQVSSTTSHSASFSHAAASLSARRLSTLAPVPPISALLRLAQGERDRSRVILYPCSSGQSGAAPRWRLRVSSNYPSPCPLLSLSLCPRSSPGNGASLQHSSTAAAVVYNTSIRRLAGAPYLPCPFYAQRLVTSRPCIKRCRY